MSATLKPKPRPKPKRHPNDAPDDVVEQVLIIGAFILMAGIVGYLAYRLYVGFLAPVFGFFGGIFAWIGGVIGTLAHPVSAADINQNMWVQGLSGYAFVYLLAAAAVYGILTLFGMSRGWKVVCALFLPFILLLLTNQKKWTHRGGGWYRGEW